MEYTRSPPTLRWDEISIRSDALIISLRADSRIPHRLKIQRDVLEDAVSYSNPDLACLARENRHTIEYAVAKAWAENREQEIVEIGGPGHFVWLHLTAGDFQ